MRDEDFGKHFTLQSTCGKLDPWTLYWPSSSGYATVAGFASKDARLRTSGDSCLGLFRNLCVPGRGFCRTNPASNAATSVRVGRASGSSWIRDGGCGPQLKGEMKTTA